MNIVKQIEDVVTKGRAYLEAIGLQRGIHPFYDRAYTVRYSAPVMNTIKEVEAAFAPFADKVIVRKSGGYTEFPLRNGGRIGVTTNIGGNKGIQYIDLIAESETA